MALATVVAVALPWAVRRVVRDRVAASLIAAGWRVDDIRVRRIGLREAELAGIRISRGITLSAGRLKASYSPRRLLAGQIDEVSVDQGRVIADVADGWGGVVGELRALAGDPDDARPPAVADLRVRPLTVLVVRGAERWAARIDEATLTADGRGARILAVGGGQRAALLLEAETDPHTRSSRLRVEVPARSAAELLRIIEAVDGVEAETGRTVRCDLTWDGATDAFSATVGWPGSVILRTGGEEIAVCDLDLDAQGRAEPGGGLAAVEGLLRLAEARSGNLAIRGLESSFRADAGVVEVSLSAQDAPWRDFTVRADVSGAVPQAQAAPGPPPGPSGRREVAIPIEILVEGPRWRSGDFAFSAEALGFSVRLRPEGESWSPSRVEVRLDGGEVRCAPMALVCDGLRGVLLFDEADGFEGRASADALHVGSCFMPPLELAFSGGAGNLSGRLLWQRNGQEILRFAGGWEGDATAPIAGSLGLTAAPWPSGRSDPILACVRSRTGWEILRGRVEASAELDCAGEGIAGRGRVRVRDLVVAWGDLRVEGLDGEIEISDLLRGAASASQSIRWEALVLPRTRAASGEAVFRLDPGWRLTPESFTCLWGGGRISADGFDVDAARGRARTTVELAGVEVAEVMRTLFGEAVTGEGSLDGRLPVSLRWLPGPGLTLGEGVVAAPGPGRLRVKDPGVARRWVSEARGAGGGPVAENVRERLAASLGDFEYSTLRLTSKPGPGGRPSAELDVAGKGAGAGGLPLRFTLRVAVHPLPE